MGCQQNDAGGTGRPESLEVGRGIVRGCTHGRVLIVLL
jgi:hypothetical protein